VMEGTSHSSSNATDVDIPPEAQPPAPAATLVKDMDMNECSSHDRNRDLTDTSDSVRDEENVKVKFETLRAMEQGETIDIDSHMSDRSPTYQNLNGAALLQPSLEFPGKYLYRTCL